MSNYIKKYSSRKKKKRFIMANEYYNIFGGPCHTVIFLADSTLLVRDIIRKSIRKKKQVKPTKVSRNPNFYNLLIYFTRNYIKTPVGVLIG